jgi:hypothetical protein
MPRRVAASTLTMSTPLPYRADNDPGEQLRGNTVTLVLAVQDQTPAESPGRQRYRGGCSGDREPGGTPTGTGTGQRPKGANWRTSDEGKPEDGGRRRRTRRANGKPEASPPGTPEAVRSGPKPPGESPGIWGRTHLRWRWRNRKPSGQYHSHRRIVLVLPMPLLAQWLPTAGTQANF